MSNAHWRQIIWLMTLLLGLPALADEPQALLPLSNQIARELRCPAAVNQSLYESEAPIASELKAQIYQMLQQGKTREQIIDFMVQRYGERIRYQPSLNPATWLLWAAPLLLVIGCGALLLGGRKQEMQP
ncbi:cytochrome c-type biogenesis protein CcmH [Shewanella sp. YIC-542]|uniref:cytochrome c-type biogenesis protein n=1 Tax=Shewanella mytili TaxID=3377111 RepID=UPI00398E5B46